jgi:predicted Zn-dependent protease
MSFEFGPPAVVKPAHELSGEILLAVGRPADARREFETSLAHAPGRSLSLLGLARAAAASGDAALSRDAYAQLEAQWSGSDADVTGRGEVFAAVGK